MNLGTRNPGFGSAMEKWVLGKLNNVFVHFFYQICSIFDDFSKWIVKAPLWGHYFDRNKFLKKVDFRLLPNIGKLSNMGKLKKKNLVQFLLKPFFGLVPDIRKR